MTATGLETFHTRQGYSGKRPGSVLIERLRAAPTTASRLGKQAVAWLVSGQAQLVRSQRATIRQLDAAIAESAKGRPRAEPIAGLPRIGTVNLG
ncbi:hypothetical protein [Saccharopolyspora spinosa]|uniref:hypothetical protein n=1 Tax=Saccharopolyspora spinosa TaxID=60894 RepID=UPI000237962E|nr:hypothetical protein [Saccharopolyspora spinosa]